MLDFIQKHEFEHAQTLQKKLTKQEILNLFNKHRDTDYYQQLEEEMLSGESLALILTNRSETKFDEEKKEEFNSQTQRKLKIRIPSSLTPVLLYPRP